jgi:cyclopropane fatty-acyl-phospholipid synthase-like methyltransferase
MYDVLDNRFYEENSEEYFSRTVNVDPSSFLNPLLTHLTPGSTVLDIGCGSGRDLLWLKIHGFNPTGLERASQLAEMARHHSQCDVINSDFMSYDFSKHSFDCLLSVGSLVHVKHDELASVISSFLQSLSKGGLFLLTTKCGDGFSKSSDSRVFALWRPEKIEIVFRSLNLSILELSTQESKLRKKDMWLSYLLKC